MLRAQHARQMEPKFPDILVRPRVRHLGPKLLQRKRWNNWLHISSFFWVSTYLFVRCSLITNVSSASVKRPPKFGLVCSWLILGTSALIPLREKISLYLCLAMASTSSNKMVIPSPDWNLLQVDYDKVNRYMFDRLTYPPSTFTNRQGHTIFANVNQNQICEHTLHHRPCPCSIDKYRFFHPEFFLKTATSSGHLDNGDAMPIKENMDPFALIIANNLRADSSIALVFSTASWSLTVATTTPARGSQFFCCDPNLKGQTPLYVARYQDVQFCLTHQPFITREVHFKRAWKGQVPSPRHGGRLLFTSTIGVQLLRWNQSTASPNTPARPTTLAPIQRPPHLPSFVPIYSRSHSPFQFLQPPYELRTDPWAPHNIQNDDADDPPLPQAASESMLDPTGRHPRHCSPAWTDPPRFRILHLGAERFAPHADWHTRLLEDAFLSLHVNKGSSCFYRLSVILRLSKWMRKGPCLRAYTGCSNVVQSWSGNICRRDGAGVSPRSRLAVDPIFLHPLCQSRFACVRDVGIRIEHVVWK